MTIHASFEFVGSPFGHHRRLLEAVPHVGDRVTPDGVHWYTVREVQWRPESPFAALAQDLPEGYDVALNPHIILS